MESIKQRKSSPPYTHQCTHTYIAKDKDIQYSLSLYIFSKNPSLLTQKT